MKQQAKQQPDSNYLVLLQHRTDSQYNDFIGKYYHFPKKYLTLLSNPGIRFVYYEPTTRGEGVYFGYGEVTAVFEDKTQTDHYFAAIENYKPFSKEVPFRAADASTVRQLDRKTLDEICLDGGILLSFNADAHLVQVLGEQLIANERVGILELIKNAYDAKASKCKVEIHNIPDIPPVEPERDLQVTELPGPVIVIEDNGSGMSREDIENGWLRPASRIKTDVKVVLKEEREKALKRGNIGLFRSWLRQFKIANNGRLPLGEKGVGRFATNRLGRYLLLTTKTESNDYEFVLRIDWNDFDSRPGHPVNLDSIGIALTRQAPSRDYGPGKSGTRLVMYGGREGFNVTKEDVQKVYDSIQSLNSPFKNPFAKEEIDRNRFDVSFTCAQLDHELKSEDIYDIAPPVFIVDGVVDEHGVLDYEIQFKPPPQGGIPFPEETFKGKFDLRNAHGTTFKQGVDQKRDPVCGAFYIHVDAWYRSSPWMPSASVSQASDWLDSYGGVALYRDGVNLFPADWGTVYDWLGLSKSHIKKGSRISYYNLYGYVEIFQDSNVDLIDKTDRQGLLENEAFRELQKLVQTVVLTFLGKEFRERREDFSSLKKSIVRDNKGSLKQVSEESSLLLENVLSRYDVIKDPLTIVQSFGAPAEREARLVSLKQSLEGLGKSINQVLLIEERLVEHAGFGLSAAIAIHELAKITGNFYNGITQLIKTERVDKVKLQDLKDAASSLKTELKNLSPLRAVRNEPKQSVSLVRVLDYVHSFYERTFESEGVRFRYVGGDFTVHDRFGTLAQVFTNLFDNSIYWLGTIDKPSRAIEVHLDPHKRTVLVADSGPGIDESIMRYLFQPGASLKTPPSGLGLYICQYYMSRMKGQIGLANEKDRIGALPGAQFILDFSRVDQG